MARRTTTIARGPGLAQLGSPTKETGVRTDFRDGVFDVALESHGYRLAWTRASFCPCVPLNNQTEQANPTCALCRGTGYVYFAQKQAQDPALVGQLTDVQAALLKNTGAMVIRGLMTGIGRRERTYEEIGHYVEGEASCSVRPFNTLGRLDRLVQMDSLVVYTQKTISPGPGAPLKLRYPVISMNLLAASTDAVTTRLYEGQDFDVALGKVVFRGDKAPPAGTYMAAHYTTMPTWLVTEQPHSVRLQNVLAKVASPVTPEGNLQYLPLQAQVRLEWLVGQNDAPTLV
jgi:hypothetical protein